MPSSHVRAMTVFTLTALALWAVLRGHPERYLPVAWGYELICLAEYSSALIFVSPDEMRILWFFVNIPGVYLLLGQRAGLWVTVLTLLGLGLGNRYLPSPYSPNAMATVLLGLAYIGVFFHVFGNRSLSYFVRMRESNAQLQHMAAHDLLTGVLNARTYYTRCDQLVHLAAREDAPYAVLFIDLDHFKAINDTHGHAAGDTVLQAVAALLAQGVRQSDVVGRIGGEEFSVFLPHTRAEGAMQLAETLRAAIEALRVPVAAEPLQVTASIGVALGREGVESVLSIQREADQAMYQAKRQGRNRVCRLHADVVTGAV